MTITIHSTNQIVEIVAPNGATVPARLWEGETDSGIKVACLVTRIAAHKDDDLQQFELELQETRRPDIYPQPYDLRVIL